MRLSDKTHIAKNVVKLRELKKAKAELDLARSNDDHARKITQQIRVNETLAEAEHDYFETISAPVLNLQVRAISLAYLSNCTASSDQIEIEVSDAAEACKSNRQAYRDAELRLKLSRDQYKSAQRKLRNQKAEKALHQFEDHHLWRQMHG